MTRLFTLEQLRDRVRQCANMEDDGDFITDSELSSYINESVAELYDLILETESGEVFVKNHTIPEQVGTYSYRLNSDFYKLASVHYHTGGRYYSAYNTDPRRFAEHAANPPEETAPLYYLRFDPVTGVKDLFVFPEVDENNLAITYMPYCPQMSNDDDTWDGFNGWEEYAVVSAAIKCLEKQEQDTAAYQMRLQRLEKRIRSQSAYMDAGLPDIIQRVSRRDR